MQQQKILFTFLIKHLQNKIPDLIDLEHIYEMLECRFFIRNNKGIRDFDVSSAVEADEKFEEYRNRKDINVILDRRSRKLYIKGKFIQKLGAIRTSIISCLLENEKEVCLFETFFDKVWGIKGRVDDIAERKALKDNLWRNIFHIKQMSPFFKKNIEPEIGEGYRAKIDLRRCCIIAWKE